MLKARALDDWPPDYGDWPDIVELLTATILRDDPKFARAEQDITNDALACISALASVRTYIYAAQVQMRRIHEGLASTEYLPHWHAFPDIHFYFICWSRVLAMITLVEERSGLSVQAPPSDRAELERYKDARHHLEHHAERLPGGPRMLRPESDSLDLGNLVGDGASRQWSHWNELWDVSEKSLAALREIAFRFETDVLDAALLQRNAGV